MKMHSVASIAFAAAAVIATTGLTTTTASACPDWTLDGRSNLGTLTGSFLFTPRSYTVQAGGNNNLAGCSAPGTGYVISDPDFEFNFTNDGNYGRLEFEVTGDCDTVLLINDASGQWHFNDDTNGVNPAINVVNPPQGTYDIWVGTYGQSSCAASIEIETWSS
ncbi:MAG: peptidase S1 [Pseudomonadota bacterium]